MIHPFNSHNGVVGRTLRSFISFGRKIINSGFADPKSCAERKLNTLTADDLARNTIGTLGKICMVYEAARLPCSPN